MREIRVLLWYAWRRKLVFVLANANFLWYDYTILQPGSRFRKAVRPTNSMIKKIETVRWTDRITGISVFV